MPVLESWRDVLGRVCATGWREEDQYVIDVVGVGCFAFSNEGPVRLEQQPPDVSPEARDRALRSIVLPLVAQARGSEILHSSCVEMNGKVVAFVGSSHAGKSTFASALACRGWALRADDAMCFEIDRGAPLNVRLPCVPDLRPETQQWLGAKMENLRISSSEERLPIAAIFIVEPSTDKTVSCLPWKRLSPAAAFRMLLRHAHVFTLQHRSRTLRMVENYLSLAEAVPVYRLKRGRGFQHLPALLEMIEGVASRDSIIAA